MKKFLSLVLALVLTMSLVVVPANADGEQTPPGGGTQQTGSVTGLSIVGDETAYPGESKTYRVTGTPAIADASNVSVTGYSWTETTGFTGTSTSTSNSYTGTAGTAGSAQIQCTVTVSYTPNNGTEATATVTLTLTKSVTIADKYVLTANVGKSTLYFNGTEPYKKTTVTATLKEKGKVVSEGNYTIALSENSNLLDTNGTTISVASTASSAQSNIPVTVTATRLILPRLPTP